MSRDDFGVRKSALFALCNLLAVVSLYSGCYAKHASPIDTLIRVQSVRHPSSDDVGTIRDVNENLGLLRRDTELDFGTERAFLCQLQCACSPLALLLNGLTTTVVLRRCAKSHDNFVEMFSFLVDFVFHNLCFVEFILVNRQMCRISPALKAVRTSLIYIQFRLCKFRSSLYLDLGTTSCTIYGRVCVI